MKGDFLNGEVDFEQGILTSNLLPTQTAAHIQANTETTVDERSEATKRLLDSNNSSRPDGNMLAMAAGQNPEDHNMQMDRQFIRDSFATVP